MLALLGIGAILWWGMSRGRDLLTDTSLFGPVLEDEASRLEADNREPSTGIFEPRTFDEERPPAGAAVRPQDLDRNAGLPRISGDTTQPQAAAPPTTTTVVPAPVEFPDAAPHRSRTPRLLKPLDISGRPYRPLGLSLHQGHVRPGLPARLYLWAVSTRPGADSRRASRLARSGL
ncbi:MAG: hypothetical protein HC929_17215 [Leptolyngbyaceae cyanobacterium SM2_5_2]|nr:hypothetical protein [Leptolyngbyaceae cyanobacterium SM2_5_2]